MRRFLIPFAIAAAAGAVTTACAVDPRPSGWQREQARLARELARLTPGKPVDCIDTRWGNTSLRAMGDKLVYRVNARLIYVSDTGGGCERVARGDALVTRQFGTRLCRGDMATTVDMVSRIQTGSCAIGRFTPYTAR